MRRKAGLDGQALVNLEAIRNPKPRTTNRSMYFVQSDISTARRFSDYVYDFGQCLEDHGVYLDDVRAESPDN